MNIRNPLDEAALSCVSGSTSLECDALMIFDVRPRNLAWIKKTACRNVSRERNRETHLIILVNTSIYKLEMMAWKKVWYFNCCYFSNFRKEWHVSHHFSPKARVHQCQPPCCQGIFRAAAARAAVGTSRDEWVKNFMGHRKFAEDFLKNRAPIQENWGCFWKNESSDWKFFWG